MKHFLDLGAHKLEGLKQFTQKLNIDKSWNVYSYEPNILIKEEVESIVKDIQKNYGIFEFHNKAVTDKSEKIIFNCHKGAWTNQTKNEYWDHYTMGSNALNSNPSFDTGNGVVFDSVQYEIESISIDEILENICLKDSDAEIYIKCDIEGSEFVVVPCIIESKYSKNIVEMYIEWHERFWYHEGEVGLQNKQTEKLNYISSLNKLGIKCFDWQ